MPLPKKIRVMISSRCTDQINFRGARANLSDVRRALKADLEAQQLLGSELFEVWINEDAPPAPGTDDSWNVCMQQVRNADVVLALYNGISGWAERTGEIGICHGELQTALKEAPGKVRLIKLPLGKSTPSSKERDRKFQEFVSTQALFRGAEANTGEEVIMVAKQALRESVADLVRLGVREASRGKYSSGSALDWSRMNYGNRKQAMIKVIQSSLISSGGKEIDEKTMIFEVSKTEVLWVIDSVPAGMSEPQARESVGKPFLLDHQRSSFLTKNVVGPVHIIVCHKNVTEAQAIRLLGFADATVVATPFGIYMVDEIQKIQIVLIKECRDPTTTNLGLQSFMAWLAQTGEDFLLARRAKGRAEIIRAIASAL
jgi:hypothetical protein